MTNAWKELLPKEYIEFVIEPIFFESYMTPMNNAVKNIGFDTYARRCFYHNSSIITIENIQVKIFPTLGSIRFERDIAWRLKNGEWLKINSFTGWLDQCHNEITIVPLETMREVLK